MTERPSLDIEGSRRSHARLIETVTGIDDGAARQPTLLQGWDVAMLVTHLARNADSHAWAAEGARRGESRRRYRDAQARDSGIEAGRGRSAAQLIDDLTTSIARLEAVWDSLPTEAWAVMAFSGSGEPEPMVELPRYRWRESEIHHVDLGLGFTIEDWAGAFVDGELEVWLARLDERLPPGAGVSITATDTGRSWGVGDGAVTVQVEAPSRLLLAWLVDRHTDGFPEIGPWQW